MYRLDIPRQNEFPVLLSIWENSVKATHHFLLPGDLEVFRKIIQEQEVFTQVNMICARDKNNTILGFLGTSEDNIEMLFIDAAARGKGIGKLLLRHAIDNLNIRKVDVNEQNLQAILFYERFGFKTVSRSETDGMGKPYPILHMKLEIKKKSRQKTGTSMN
jgi:putative acetyltransferase